MTNKANNDTTNTGQGFLRAFTRAFLRIFTRTTVTGLENVPTHGPLLILANHASTIDALLLLAFLPIPQIAFVGPGDFKLLFPANLLLKWYGMIPVRRATTMERAALRAMTDVLKRGDILALFPEGGTWEKPLHEAKSGAAYISQSAAAPILPVALGGTYRVWYQVARLQRPRLSVAVGQVLPPTPATTGKTGREKALTETTHQVMNSIYALLPAADRTRYDALATQRYGLEIGVWRQATDQPRQYEILTLPGAAVLGEVIVKPNLMSPLINNAKLPLDPLLSHNNTGINTGSTVEVPAAGVALAARSFYDTILPAGKFAGYFEYRLGEQKAMALRDCLQTLAEHARDTGVQSFVFKPTSQA